MKKQNYAENDSEIHNSVKDKKEIPSDVLGSYTGVPEDGEEPIQDADDL